MENMHLVDWAALIVSVIALGAAAYGILDVREQVRILVTLERNRMFAKVIHTMVWRVVERVGDAKHFQSSGEMHEFTMLARVLDPKQTLESAQNYANKETLALAQDMVLHGIAKWRDNIDGGSVSDVVNEWQNEKNAATMRKIFEDHPPLTKPDMELMS